MDIRGSCHCGNIRFELAWPREALPIPARACDCSFCVKHGGVWTAHPQATLRVTFADGAAVEAYRFGTATADFHVCRGCGVAPVVTSTIEGRRYAVISVNALDDLDPTWLQHARVSFEGEDSADRLARRQRNWIADVTLVHDGSPGNGRPDAGVGRGPTTPGAGAGGR